MRSTAADRVSGRIPDRPALKHNRHDVITKVFGGPNDRRGPAYRKFDCF